MIVRLMGEGQYRVDDELVAALNDLDDQVLAALGRDDEAELDRYLDEMWQLVKARGTEVPLDEIATSDIVIPPSDLTLEETRTLMEGDEGLIPDIPTQ